MTPKQLQKVQDIDEFSVSRFTGNRVKRHKYQATVWMLFIEGLETFLMFCLDMFCRFDFNCHLCIADYDIHLFLVVSMPIRDNVTLIVVPFVGNDLLHHEVLEGMAVIVSTPLQGMTPHQVVG